MAQRSKKDTGVQSKSKSKSLDFSSVAPMLKSLAHPVRMTIIQHLLENEMHVKRLTEVTGEAQAIVSQHLKILRMHALVESKWHDGYSYYRVTDPRISRLFHCLLKKPIRNPKGTSK